MLAGVNLLKNCERFITLENGMSSETELKLLLAPQDHQKLLEVPCLKGREVVVMQLDNTYFDTPEQDLNNCRVALRIRRNGDRFIQTLKTKGVSINGLSRRGEWEWELQEPVLNLDELKPVWPDSLNRVDLTRLAPVFRTDFQRSQICLHWQGADLELALDSGQIKAGEKVEVISELELELKDGPESALHDLAGLLGQQVQLVPGDISKAERGYQLGIN